MEGRGLSARVTTLTALVDACAKLGDAVRAEKWMERMTARGIEPNVVSYSAMIDACAKAGKPARALQWFEAMRMRGVTPNEHSIAALVDACAKAGDTASACWLLESMESSGLTPDVVIYSSVLDACAKTRDTVLAKHIFGKMRRHGVQPNIVAYAALARVFAHRGEWHEVEALARQMTAESQAMNEYFLYTQLLAYAKGKPQQAERAEQVFRDALAMGVKVNKHVFTALQRAVGRSRGLQLAEELRPGDVLQLKTKSGSGR